MRFSKKFSKNIQLNVKLVLFLLILADLYESET